MLLLRLDHLQFVEEILDADDLHGDNLGELLHVIAGNSALEDDQLATGGHFEGAHGRMTVRAQARVF